MYTRKKYAWPNKLIATIPAAITSVAQSLRRSLRRLTDLVVYMSSLISTATPSTGVFWRNTIHGSLKFHSTIA